MTTYMYAQSVVEGDVHVNLKTIITNSQRGYMDKVSKLLYFKFSSVKLESQQKITV